jgi:glutathione synthase/RimK-type ligase-like ATP-grasp enzyme
MNKLLVVAKNPETYFIKRLIKEVGQGGVLLFNPWKDLAPTDYDRVLFRSSGIYHSDKDLEFVRHCNRPVLNPLEALERFRSKSSQYQFFAERFHPYIPWQHLKDFTGGEGWFLVKPDVGQGGWGIQVLTSSQMLTFKQHKLAAGDPAWLVQPYVEATEYRVFFMGADRYTLKRLPRDARAPANFAQEGLAEVVSMPAHFKESIEKLITDSGAYYGAIDLLDPDSGPVVLEVNVVPGIEQLEQLTHLNIVSRLLTANFFCQKS